MALTQLSVDKILQIPLAAKSSIKCVVSLTSYSSKGIPALRYKFKFKSLCAANFKHPAKTSTHKSVKFKVAKF